MADNKTISLEEVAHMATLSRLSVSEEEQTLFARQMGDILAYMDVLARVDTKDVEPLYSPAQHPGPLRDDVSARRRERNEVLANAPEADGEYFILLWPGQCSSPAQSPAPAHTAPKRTALRKPQCRTYLRTP